jgi:hypothetical protein
MVRGSTQPIFKTFRNVSNPFCALIFVGEERASETIKSKIQSLFSAERRQAQDQNGIKGGQSVGGNVYAGFELELAGAER